ncbi:uncharacterized protein LOC126780532 [Nymphalis io]|uniref:uncharacterized protein LOC126780532 n=1 Tax=Inachis io TaxID=171585 RepID=UPI002167190F|nr:uncharacterized protein LOC126780532 [Nymphalis io]
MLLAPGWSVGPGHCIAMRSDPELSHLLFAWRIKYKYSNTDVTIKRSIVHPHFNRDTFANNIGLVQHVTLRGQLKYNMGSHIDSTLNNYETDKIVIISWNFDTIQYKDKHIVKHPVQVLNEEKCSIYMTPIIELRSYEFCTTIGNDVNTTIGHGALICNRKGSHTFGFFTWGERQERSLPLVILNLTNFQEWLKTIITF